jgi:hypothetical protein
VCSLAVLADGRVAVLGGNTRYTYADPENRVQSMAFFDPSTFTWEERALPGGVGFSTVVGVGNQLLLIGDGPPTAALLDPTTGAMTAVVDPPLPVVGEDLLVVPLDVRTFLVLGGRPVTWDVTQILHLGQ